MFVRSEVQENSSCRYTCVACLSYSYQELTLSKNTLFFVFFHVTDWFLFLQVKAPAKAGAIAPVDVWVPAGNTGMGPEKTSFYQVS